MNVSGPQCPCSTWRAVAGCSARLDSPAAAEDGTGGATPGRYSRPRPSGSFASAIGPLRPGDTQWPPAECSRNWRPSPPIDNFYFGLIHRETSEGGDLRFEALNRVARAVVANHHSPIHASVRDNDIGAHAPKFGGVARAFNARSAEVNAYGLPTGSLSCELWRSR